jgi:hypothetical protein
MTKKPQATSLLLLSIQVLFETFQTSGVLLLAYPVHLALDPASRDGPGGQGRDILRQVDIRKGWVNQTKTEVFCLFCSKREDSRMLNMSDKFLTDRTII